MNNKSKMNLREIDCDAGDVKNWLRIIPITVSYIDPIKCLGFTPKDYLHILFISCF